MVSTGSAGAAACPAVFSLRIVYTVYTAYISNITRPSTMLKVPFVRKNISISVAAKQNGRSRRTAVRPTDIGCMTAQSPTMKNTLNMLLPMILPKAISAVPLKADVKLTQSSGIDVPSATTVSPIISSDILKRRAMLTEPSVRLSAPRNTMAMPTMINSMSIIDFLYYMLTL